MSCGSENHDRCRCTIDEDTPLSLAVIECVTEAAGGDPEDRPPLYEAIDPEALNELFRDRERGEITFTYLDFEITVKSDAEIVSRRLDHPPVVAD